MVQLISVDLDGTLLRWNKTVSSRNIQALINVQKRGHKVALVTGRALQNSLEFADLLQLNKYGGYIGSYNGSTIYDCKKEEVIKESSIDHEILKTIIEILELNKLDYTAMAKTVQYVPKVTRMAVNLYRKYNGKKIRPIEDVFANKAAIKKVLVNDFKSKLLPVRKILEEKFGDKISMSISSFVSLEITSSESNKGRALEYIAQLEGIDLKDTIAFGNQGNDLTMIKKAGIGVAVANATREVKEIADQVTRSNNRDGVGKFLELYFMLDK